MQQIQTTLWFESAAFGAILADETGVAWGNEEDGSDSSAVHHQPTHVQQIQTTLWLESAGFVAILADEMMVVTV